MDAAFTIGVDGLREPVCCRELMHLLRVVSRSGMAGLPAANPPGLCHEHGVASHSDRGVLVHARARLPMHAAGGGRIMQFRAAILEAPGQSLVIDTVETGPLRPQDVLVRIGAAGICHTDLEVIAGQLVCPMPIALGHEAAGTIVDVGNGTPRSRIGERVVLSWNPHCGHCFYCDAGQPILCETYTRLGPKAVQFDGCTRLHRRGAPVR
ncbi:MAG TPA: alcohol dehydrogenase catalytic domain-containing protein, partial [Acetobacteraceae bacterium]|nr:alcohol dehydrogenase catalytic domain-containing protein [Acetobacteraceae bacterium]